MVARERFVMVIALRRANAKDLEQLKKLLEADRRGS